MGFDDLIEREDAIDDRFEGTGGEAVQDETFGPIEQLVVSYDFLVRISA